MIAFAIVVVLAVGAAAYPKQTGHAVKKITHKIVHVVEH